MKNCYYAVPFFVGKTRSSSLEHSRRLVRLHLDLCSIKRTRLLAVAVHVPQLSLGLLHILLELLIESLVRTVSKLASRSTLLINTNTECCCLVTSLRLISGLHSIEIKPPSPINYDYSATKQTPSKLKKILLSPFYLIRCTGCFKTQFCYR